MIWKSIGGLLLALPFFMFFLVPINNTMTVYCIVGIISIFGLGLFLIVKDLESQK